MPLAPLSAATLTLLRQSLARADHDRHERPRGTLTSGEPGGLVGGRQETRDDVLAFGVIAGHSRSRPQKSFAVILVALVGLVLSAAYGCGTDAVGIEDCRQIEQARCDAGAACGLVKDVEACKRYYRDHCLHGLAIPDSPGPNRVKACVTAISAAAQCARDLGPQAPIASCSPDVGLTALSSACEVVNRPEETEPCRFLVPDTPPPTFDAGSDSIDSDAGAD